MVVKEFIADKDGRVSKILCEYDDTLSYFYVQKLIRNKDVKINGKRISSDVSINVGDSVAYYVNISAHNYKDDIYFEDENILIIFKHREIEVCDSDDSLLNRLVASGYAEIYPVHRLDRNTEGLMIFAKNKRAKNELDFSIKNHLIQKYYYALVFGVPCKSACRLTGYLKKDSDRSIVKISDRPLPGYSKIQTNFEVVKTMRDNKSLLSVELVTGKTHQIRAHLAFAGFPIVGDEKYGNAKLNKKEGLRFQCLCAYKLVFNLKPDSFLSYLNDMKFELDLSQIDFCKNL